MVDSRVETSSSKADLCQAPSSAHSTTLRAAAILEAAIDCIIAADHRGCITEFNPAAERTFGYRRGDVIGKVLADVLVPPSRRESDLADFSKYLAAGDPQVLGRRVETMAMRADGTEFPVELAISRLTIDGRPYFTVYLRDVTEQRALEETLARRARQAALRADISGLLARTESFRQMLQDCADALVRHLHVAFARIWTVSADRTVLELQTSAGLYTHIDGAHARIPVGALKIGMIASERVPHVTNAVRDDPRVHDKAWAAREGLIAFAGYPLIVDDRVVGVMAMFARHPLYPDTLETLGSVASSIAQGIERKRAAEKLRRSEAYLAEGQRLSHTGSWAWNLQTGERFWSEEVFRIYGFAPAPTPPSIAAVVRRIHPSDIDNVRRIIDDAVRAQTGFRFQKRVVIAGLPLKYVETVGHPVPDLGGKLIEYFGTDIDVTDRIRASRLLRRAIRTRYAAVLEERTRLAQEMHDGLLQDITGIALHLRALLPHARTSPDACAHRLEELVALAERMSREARQAVAGIRRAEGVGDLVAVVEDAARRVVGPAPVALAVSVSGRSRAASAKVCDAATAIAHEALTNVVRHSGAHSAQLKVVFGRSRVRMQVIDDGCGVGAPSPASLGDHFGIRGMRERAAGVGARFTLECAARGGTVVTVDLPYR